MDPSSSSFSTSGYQLEIAKNPEDVQLCQALRYDVFIEEQKVPKDAELDGKDKDAFHVICWYEGQVVATGRVFLLESSRTIASCDSTRSTFPEERRRRPQRDSDKKGGYLRPHRCAPRSSRKGLG
jgi:hypothetical protein